MPDFSREYRNSSLFPIISVCGGVGILAIMAITGTFEAIFNFDKFDLEWFFTTGIAVLMLLWSIWGVRDWLGIRVIIVVDQDGITEYPESGKHRILYWEDIVSISYDAHPHYRLLLKTRNQDKGIITHMIKIGGLNSTPHDIYTNVIECHAASRPVDDPCDEEDMENFELPPSNTKVSNKPDRSITFRAKPRLPFDPRYLNAVLLAVFITGLILEQIQDHTCAL